MKRRSVTFARLSCIAIALGGCFLQAMAADEPLRAPAPSTLQQPPSADRQLADLREQLARVDAEIARAQAGAGSGRATNQQLDDQKMQELLDQRSRIQQMISSVVRKSSSTSQTTIGNIK